MSDRVTVFDTTLRDGEQSAGVLFSERDKLDIAERLAAMRVDVIEAGFPAASPIEWRAVHAVAQQIRGASICALARCVAGDIDAAAESLAGAARPRIHVFVNASDVQLEHQLRRSYAQVVELTRSMIARARLAVGDVEFSPMDATRADWYYVCEILEAVIDAGATTVNIADTTGFAQPDELGMMITYIREHVINIEQTTLSVHCHDDLGLAVANSLAAIKAGARQVECCVNGIGERAGNAALEELVMALTVRRDHHHVEHGIKLEELVPTSALLQQFTGVLVQPNKAIVGANAFAHEDGMLKEARPYGMSAAAVGAAATLGRGAGQPALRARLEQLGLLLSQEELNHAFAGFESLADYKKEVTDEDLKRLAQKGRRAAEGVFEAIGHVYR
jgi:2-isopropylmalate synthase